MAVGDLLDLARIPEVRPIVVLEARVSHPVDDIRDLVEAMIYDLPRGESLRRRRSWLGSPLAGTFGAPGSSRSSPVSLVAALNQHHDVHVFGTPLGLEAVAVPFGHMVVLIGNRVATVSGSTERMLQRLLQREFAAFADPMAGINVMLREILGLGVGRIQVSFGQGIFVPSANEDPVGRVTVKSLWEDSGGEATTPGEPKLPSGKPAGLYRGQRGLVFAGSPLVAPASCSLMPDGPVVLALANDPESGALSLRSLVADVPTPSDADDDPPNPYSVDRASPEANEDAAFEVHAPGNAWIRVGVELDCRLSRLLSRPPQDGGYAIIGLAAPQDRSDRLVDRWWVDIDHDGHLIGSAMRTRAATVICTEREIEVYDWLQLQFDRSAGARYRLEIITTASGPVLALTNVGHRPWGYVNAPTSSTEVRFDQVSRAHSSWSFDWLDFAGAVETPSGRTVRLAVDTLDARRPAEVPSLAATMGSTLADPDGQVEASPPVLIGPLILAPVAPDLEAH